MPLLETHLQAAIPSNAEVQTLKKEARQSARFLHVFSQHKFPESETLLRFSPTLDIWSKFQIFILFLKLMWFLGNSVAFLNAVLRWKNGLWSSAILASESEAEHSEKENHHTELQTYRTDHTATTESSLNHWITSREAFSSEIFSAGSISSAWLCVSVLSWQRWESDPAKSNPSILASWPAIQLEPKKMTRPICFCLYFVCLCLCWIFFFWSVRSFVVCLGLCCFRFYFCMFIVWFYGKYVFRSFFCRISARPWHESFGLPRQICKRWQEPQECWNVTNDTSIGDTLETNKNNRPNNWPNNLHIFVFVSQLLFACNLLLQRTETQEWFKIWPSTAVCRMMLRWILRKIVTSASAFVRSMRLSENFFMPSD